MRFKLSAVELHNPLFIGSINLGQKIGKGKAKPVDSMDYDTELQCVIVRHRGATTLVALPTVAFMDLEDPTVLDIQRQKKAPALAA